MSVTTGRAQASVPDLLGALGAGLLAGFLVRDTAAAGTTFTVLGVTEATAIGIAQATIP